MIPLVIWLLAGDLGPAPAVARDGRLSMEDARHVVAAANLVATDDVPADLLLAMAYVESRFDATSTSRMEGARRKTGSWPSSSQAGKGTWFCGLVQARATTWDRCLALRDVLYGFHVGAEELRYWLRRSRGDVTLALRAHGCGHAGLRHTCNGYAERVLRRVPRYRARPAS